MTQTSTAAIAANQSKTDPQMPPDLVPHTGNLAIERVFYNSLIMIDSDLADNQPPDGEETDTNESKGHGPTRDLGHESPVDLLHSALMQGGFKRPGLGIMLTSEQSWFLGGLTLGQLLHSLPLVPGESTRIAIDSWSRVTSGQRQEDVTQTDEQTGTSQAQRSVSDVTNAVMNQTQYGTTTDQSQSSSDQSSSNVSGSVGVFSSAYNAGSSNSSARNRSLATHVSRSNGTRNLSSRTNQNINTSTHQQATEARNRRAATIKETHEGEGEEMTTRVVTNYNHMHALSMQYYEILQDYRVTTKALRHQRCLFLPLKPFNFKDPRVIVKFRAILERAALNDTVREALHEANEDNWRRTETRAVLLDRHGNELYMLPFADAKLSGIHYIVENYSAYMYSMQVHLRVGNYLNAHHNDRDRTVFTNANVAIDNISEIRMDIDNAQTNLRLIYYFSSGNQTDTYEYNLPNAPLDNGIQVNRFKMVEHTAESEATHHLQENALYYSQAIWANMPETDWIKAMEDLTVFDEPVAPTLDPIPVAIMGNYVGFLWHFADDKKKLDWLLETKLLRKDFRAWLERKGYPTTDVTEAMKDEYLAEVGEPEGDVGDQESIVPMPTGGVFAEAVLGRFNCAEKLDLTRFWNWKDSPIPIVPSEINPLTAGDRGAPQLLTDLKAAGFDPSQIHLHMGQPAAALDAASVAAGDDNAAALGALTKAGIFRDITNSAATATLASQGLQQATAAATAAGEQTTEAMRIASEQQQANLKTMANLAEQVLPMLLAPETGGASLLGEGASGAGGLMNAAKELDESGGSEGTSHQSGVLSSLGNLFGGLFGKSGGGEEKAHPAAADAEEAEAK